ncbi:META domain-containing protein [Helicobacter sp. MIT 21-1697]|uniref:META domain-containing protein n=1 Tax=Helicobacter sp. MIT 21-1697 TaxID=2993733 RepID=UPI00224B08E2|nr:META domain-containing protein [Helicobacter sp. MIT 21-1697]MCX2717166.1 META domain-containing protein [Helicobacter sp. MIT 21-1697]
MKLKYCYFVGILGALVIGCGNAQDMQRDILGKWTLNALNDGYKQIDIRLGERNAFVSFEVDKSFYGNAGCNNFFGNYEIKANNTLAINNGAGMTRMMCAPESMEIEDTLMHILGDGNSSAHISGNTLTLQKGHIKAILNKQ